MAETDFPCAVCGRDAYRRLPDGSHAMTLTTDGRGGWQRICGACPTPSLARPARPVQLALPLEAEMTDAVLGVTDAR